jgi:ubiquinone/menaquinone biosynthesis C-methylase UbiE
MSNAKGYYDEIAGGYNLLYGEEQLNKWVAARQLIEFSPQDRVLDVGCGTGLITAEIAKLVKQVVGIDFSKNMIENAVTVPNTRYVIADAIKMPFPDKSFDKVMSFTVMQDIENKTAFLRQIKRISRGLVLLTLQKRGKDINKLRKLLSKHFKIIKFLEEEKDYIFLLSA